MKPRVLIVEDEPGIADTLQYALRTEGFEPAWCATGEEALARIASEPPALVILDVGLPDASGFEIFKRIRATSEVPVVFLTARSDEIDRVVGLELGADDYVAKPFSPRELVARVRGVLRRTGKSAAAPATAAGAPATGAPPPLVVDEGRMQVRYHGRLLELSRYEFGLLKTLAGRPGHVFSRDALLERVWGNDTESMDRTVDAHVKTVRAKMKAIAPDEEPIRTHRGSGYSLAEDFPTGPSTR
jgi:two-component system, OmpR family, catabolic regulation response regulator CreB